MTSNNKKELPEIIVSKYWPTKIIKEITIKDCRDTFSHTISLSNREAQYVYEQLKAIYEASQVKKKESER